LPCCDSKPNACGFNTLGFVKSFVRSKDSLNFMENMKYNPDGIYIKKNKLPIKYFYKLDFYNQSIVDKITTHVNSIYESDKKLTLTITTCKRIDLFKRTMDSFINCCSDILLIDEFICIDDNSSDEDRETMKKLYPFFKFILKRPDDKGHVKSMNMIVDIVKTKYLLHMEDDWLFTYKYDFITKAMEIFNQPTLIPLDEIPSKQNIQHKKIAQVLFNRNYNEIDEIQVVGGYLCETNSKNFGNFLFNLVQHLILPLDFHFSNINSSIFDKLGVAPKK
jgi:hypothetical protein